MKQDDGGRMQAVQCLPGEFHWRHGITFMRLQQRLNPKAEGNGDVQLCVGGLIFRIPALEWVSIIASVGDERHDTYVTARALHFGEEMWVADSGSSRDGE